MSSFFERLLRALSTDAAAASRRLSLQLLEASLGDARLRRRARLVALAFVYALDVNRSEIRRAFRWRRFVGVLAPFAEATQSPALLRLAAENADLLADYAIQTV